MATKSQQWIAKGVAETTWTLTAADGTSGAAIEPETAPNLPDKTVQVLDNPAAGTIIIEGSHDGVTYVGLVDPGGTPISFTTAGAMETVLDNPAFLRPRATVAVTNPTRVRLVAQSMRR